MSKPKKRRRRPSTGPREKTPKMRQAYRSMIESAEVTDTIGSDTIPPLETSDVTPSLSKMHETMGTIAGPVGIGIGAKIEPGWFQRHWLTILGAIAIPVFAGIFHYLIKHGEDIASNRTDIANIKTNIANFETRSKEDRERLEGRIHDRVDRLEDKIDNYFKTKEE